jgi:hypothetical protein
LLSLFGGGIAFWIPDVVIPAINRNEQGGAVTIMCPIALLLFYLAVLRLRKEETSGPSTAFFAIFGMWVLALSFTLLAQEVRAPGGGGFGWEDFGYLLISSIVPTRIFEMVTLEGSIIALLIGTIEMIICHFAFERTRWIVPPSWATLHHPNR